MRYRQFKTKCCTNTNKQMLTVCFITFNRQFPSVGHNTSISEHCHKFIYSYSIIHTLLQKFNNIIANIGILISYVNPLSTYHLVSLSLMTIEMLFFPNINHTRCVSDSVIPIAVNTTNICDTLCGIIWD